LNINFENAHQTEKINVTVRRVFWLAFNNTWT